ncbi:hypothetical protein D0T84_10605 [Dysgonomonas sp. 521]|uniref:hypothetical protein n=1 Tax=Dysgonomonas sp. 521 TaxID=2302932 RepID=UPI0013D6AE4E|nr:hypothetical protein [Dysgonomonas sp. 521]NDV95364.1 hypothetical protein [Dysgonomonas sp. 521]
MAERTILKARVESIEFAEPIKSESELSASSWVKQPLTLRDDEVSIVEAEPETKEVFSHENDAPEDYDLIGGGLTITGSFINADYDEMAALLGGEVTGTGDTTTFKRKATKTPLNKAIRFTLKDGSSIVIPNAKGYVLLNLNVGSDGIMKFPFSFKALAQQGFNYDIIIK